MNIINTASKNARTKLLQLIAVAVCQAVLVCASPAALAQDKTTEFNFNNQALLLTNGKIHTMDKDNRVVSSVLIAGNKFVAVGDNIKVAAGTKVIDLKGRTVVPGLIDLHSHIALIANRPGYHTILDNAKSIDEILDVLKQRRKDVPEGQFITCIGLVAMDYIAPDHRLPTLKELDAAVPDRPVYIEPGFAGPAITNSLGKNWFAAKGVKVADDGVIPGGAETNTALQQLRKAFLTDESRIRNTRYALNQFASYGVTTIVDAGAIQETGKLTDPIPAENVYYQGMYTPFLALQRNAELPIRVWVNFLHIEMDTSPPSPVVNQENRLKMAFPFFGNEWMKTGGIGEFSAGGPEGLKRIAEQGWRQEQHVLFDFEQRLAEREELNKKVSIEKLRWVLAHNVPIGPTKEQLERAKKLGLGLHIFGAEVMGLHSDPRTILDSGIHVGFHSDSGDIPFSNPWIHFYSFVTGKDVKGNLFNPGQQITRQEALSLATNRARWFMNDEPLGSIEVGNYADLAVPTKNYFDTPEEDIKSIGSDLTIVNGRIVYDTGTFAKN